MSITVTLVSAQSPSCSLDVAMYPSSNGGSNGFINISVSGGTAPYSYIWTKNGLPFATTQNLNNLSAGSYSVTVTDSLGVTGTLPPYIVVGYSTYTGDQFVEGEILDWGICGSELVGHGTTVNNDLLSQTIVLRSYTNVPVIGQCITNFFYPERHITSVSTLAQTVDLTQPTDITPNATVLAPTCNGGLGSVSLSPSGGTSPYTYLWSDSSTESSISIVAGTYTVIISDAYGCGYEFTYTIPPTQPQALEISRVDQGEAIILKALFTCDSGTVTWNTGETTTTIEATIGNTYVVTLVCDHGGFGVCTSTASITIGDQDNSYWCCLVTYLSNFVTKGFNGERDCGCDTDLVLFSLIGVYERYINNLSCLTAAQMDGIITQLNNLCCDCHPPNKILRPQSLLLQENGYYILQENSSGIII